MSPAVTIGMPVYNGEQFIEAAIDSIRAQTRGDFELLISDNASTDRTPAILRSLAGRDPRILVRNNRENLGAARNYNLLTGLARGMYFKWAAHDDLLAPDYLAACVEALTADPWLCLCYPSTVMIDVAGSPTGTDPLDAIDARGDSPHERFRGYMRSAWPTLGCNAVFGVIRLDTLRKTRLIGGYASSDKVLLGELVLQGGFRQLPDRLFLRREHAGSSVRANPGLTERNQWFDPASSGGAGLIRWRWVWEYLKGILHAPITPAEKMRCLRVLQDHIRRDGEKLAAELRRPIVRAFRRPKR